METAIVVGAGIGGASAALALQRSGWEVVLLERAPALGEVGAGITVWPSAVAALNELGVKGVAQSAALSSPTGLRRANGRWVVAAAELEVGLPVLIHRARLLELILAELGPAVTVRTGYEVTSVAQDNDGVLVNGELRADLLVAADGVHSLVRGVLHPEYGAPVYSGYTAYRGIAETGANEGGETWGRGQRFGFAQMLDGRTFWYATANQASGQGGDLAMVVSRYGTWHDPIPAILSTTGTTLQNDIYDLPLPLVPFATGRIALLGDAAHAMTPNLGRGACTAIEDATALARQLTSVSDPVTALARYDAERRPVATKLVKQSRQIGRIGQLENPVVVAGRDALIWISTRASAQLHAWRRRR